MRLVLSVIGATILLACVLILVFLEKVVLVDLGTGLAIVLVGAAFTLLAWGLKPQFSKEVNLKIKNPRVTIQNVGSKHEFKNLIFDIKNNGKTEAIGCRIRIEVRGILDNLQEIVNPNLPADIDRGAFNIIPNDQISINLGQVTTEQTTTCVIYTERLDSNRLGNFVTLTKGTYELYISLVGKNFKHKKVHRLRLDLTSWKNVGIKLD